MALKLDEQRRPAPSDPSLEEMTPLPVSSCRNKLPEPVAEGPQTLRVVPAPRSSRRMPPADLDADTIERCRRRDRAALTRFIERYQRPLFAYLSRLLGRGPHVEDIAQNAFLRAIEDFPAYDARLRPFSWLLTLARAKYLQHDKFRRDRFVVLGLSLHDDDPEACSRPPGSASAQQAGPWLHPDADPERNASRAELGRAIEQVAMSLPADQREAFLLSDYHEMPASDIAVITGCNENTVKSRIRLARARLRERLQIHWSDEREPASEQEAHPHG